MQPQWARDIIVNQRPNLTPYRRPIVARRSTNPGGGGRNGVTNDDGCSAFQHFNRMAASWKTGRCRRHEVCRNKGGASSGTEEQSWGLLS